MNIFFVVFFNLLLFENIIVKYIPIYRYFDEVTTILIILLCIIKIIKNKRILINHLQKRALIYFLIFIFTGIVSSLLNGLNIEKIVIVKDLFSISKFIVCYIGSIILFNDIDKEYILDRIQMLIKIYIKIMFIFAIVNLFYDFGLGSDIRYGFRSYKFLFTHPTYLAHNVVILISILLAKNCDLNKKDVYMGLCILTLTLRTKALMFVVTYIIVKYFKKYIKELKIKYIIYMGIVGMFIFGGKIWDYFKYGMTAARPALHIVGLKLVIEYFPFGSGFGTFASSLSGEYYSPIYSRYGISGVMGLKPDMYNFMGDTFWPYIYGQFGVLGLCLFIIVIYYLFKDIMCRYRHSEEKLISSFLIFIYLLIVSTSESIFTSGSIIILVLSLTSYLGNYSNCVEDVEIDIILKGLLKLNNRFIELIKRYR